MYPGTASGGRGTAASRMSASAAMRASELRSDGDAPSVFARPSIVGVAASRYSLAIHAIRDASQRRMAIGRPASEIGSSGMSATAELMPGGDFHQYRAERTTTPGAPGAAQYPHRPATGILIHRSPAMGCKAATT